MKKKYIYTLLKFTFLVIYTLLQFTFLVGELCNCQEHIPIFLIFIDRGVEGRDRSYPDLTRVFTLFISSRPLNDFGFVKAA